MCPSFYMEYTYTRNLTPHMNGSDVIGIVIHLVQLEHIGGRPYREAILMDSRSLIYSYNLF
jgi:hypothetical protein